MSAHGPLLPRRTGTPVSVADERQHAATVHDRNRASRKAGWAVHLEAGLVAEVQECGPQRRSNRRSRQRAVHDVRWRVERHSYYMSDDAGSLTRSAMTERTACRG